jgi:hypothetical protein
LRTRSHRQGQDQLPAYNKLKQDLLSTTNRYKFVRILIGNLTSVFFNTGNLTSVSAHGPVLLQDINESCEQHIFWKESWPNKLLHI